MKIVIIGASHAGITAALNLRKLQPEAEVLLIDEDHKDGLGYVSNGINFYLKGKIHSLAEAANNERTLQASGAKLITEWRVTELDPDKHQLILTSEEGKKETLTYDKLIVATGSSPATLYKQIEAEKQANQLSSK